MNYWIFKSEPDVYGIDHLAAEPGQTTRWDGIRNYQARNNLRDRIRPGDRVLFYHSSCKNIGMAGSMEIVSAAYADPSQYDPDSEYFDARATPGEPRWYCVDVKLIEKFSAVIPTRLLKTNPATSDLSIFSQGRLSIAPLSATQWKAIHRLQAS